MQFGTRDGDITIGVLKRDVHDVRLEKQVKNE